MQSIRDRLKKTIDLSLKKNEPTESYYNNMDAFNSNAKDNIETYARALLIALDAIDELDLVIIKERIEKVFEGRSE